MNKHKNNFHEQLLGAEKLNDTYRAKYEKEVKAMIEKKLTTIGRLWYVGLALLGIGIFVFFVTLIIVVPKELPILVRLIFVVAALFGLAWAGLALLIAKKGTFNLKFHPMIMAIMGYICLCALATLFLLLGSEFPDKIKGIQFMVWMLPFLIIAAVGLLSADIGHEHLKTREKLLEIECRLAELAEKMEKK